MSLDDASLAEPPLGSQRRRKHVLASTLLIAPCSVLLLAGIVKGLDASSFASYLRRWPLTPLGLADAIALLVVNLEVLVGLAGVIGIKRRTAALGALALLGTFTVWYLVHLFAFGGTPPCHCLGAWLSRRALDRETWLLLGRNVLLMGCLGGGLWLSTEVRHRRESPRAAPPADHQPDRAQLMVHRGFSLLEILVVVAVLAVLIGLTLPALKGARSSSQRLGSLSNLRQHGTAFAAYTADFQDYWPLFTHPDRRVAFLCSNTRFKPAYFEGYFCWNAALAPQYYGGNCLDASFRTPEMEDLWFPNGTSYWYSDVFIADPQYWTYALRKGPAQWRATRASEVTSPSKKALHISVGELLSDEQTLDRERSPGVGFVDGSVRNVRLADIRPGHRDGPGARTILARPHDFPTMHTLKGVHGRDVD